MDQGFCRASQLQHFLVKMKLCCQYLELGKINRGPYPFRMSRLSTKERREVALGEEIIGGASIFKCLNVLNVLVRVAEVQEIELSLTFLRHEFLYLACIGTVFWFFCAVLKINPAEAACRSLCAAIVSQASGR